MIGLLRHLQLWQISLREFVILKKTDGSYLLYIFITSRHDVSGVVLRRDILRATVCAKILLGNNIFNRQKQKHSVERTFILPCHLILAEMGASA